MPRSLVAVALTIGVALAACGRSRGPSSAPAGPPAPAGGSGAAMADRAAPVPAAQREPASSRLVEPERVRHAARIAATGTLKARQSAALAMSVAGTLASVAVRRGQEVRQGALLASLDAGIAAAAVRQAEAAVTAARAQLALADDALGRVSRIRAEEGASEAQLVQARAQRDLAAAQLAAAEAQLEQARVHLAHHTLRAPFRGVVTAVPDGIGIAVAAGAPLVTLVGTRVLVLQTSLTQEDAAGLRPGAKVQVTVPATGARSGESTLSAIVPAVDSATNRVPIEIAVPNDDGRFLANAFAHAEFPRGPERPAFKVPAAALLQRDGGYALWVAGDDGHARALPVRLLEEERDAAIVVPEAGSWPAGLRVIEAPPLGIAEGILVAEGGH